MKMKVMTMMMARTMKMQKLLIIVDDDDDDDDGGGDHFVRDVKGTLASSLPSTRPAIIHEHSEGAELVANNTNANTP